MKVILFGATGMVGRGVLRECLLDAEVESVLAVVREPGALGARVAGDGSTGGANAKLRELVHRDFLDFTTAATALTGFDACFFCLGVSSAGMIEKDYSRVTYDFTMTAARVLAERNPRMTFIYVSGAGTDSSERGRSMWARVKGKTENALAKLPFKAYMFRPGFIQPMQGVTSKTKLYRVIYAVLSPLYPVFKAIAPSYVTTSENVGLAMIRVARQGAEKRILENTDINGLAGQSIKT